MIEQDGTTRLRPVRPLTRTAGATTVAGAPQQSMTQQIMGRMAPRAAQTPTATAGRQQIHQNAAPIRPAAPGSMLTTQAPQDAGLRNDVYTPGGDARLGGAQNRTDAAA